MKNFTLLFMVIALNQISHSQWQIQNSGTTENLNDITVVPYTNGNSVIVVGDNGTVLKTTNNGNEWVSILSGITNNLCAVSFCTNYDGVIVGDNSNHDYN